MTPKVVRGRSFKGVGQYLLHDKGTTSSERVTFTETLNLPTDNARSAIAHMIDTATHADDIKRRAGVSLRGQKQQRPVYHYSLAWHPSENVTMAVQVEAARESLEALGFDDRQALIVSHNDTEHPHVHVVVNLVSTENGKFPKLSNDYLKFSEWALEYEKRRGVVFCKDREENQQRRKEEYVKDQSLTRQEWTAWKKSQTKDIWDSFRADREKASASRKAQYDALWQQKEERFAFRRDEIKQLYKPIWRDVFKQQRRDLKAFDAAIHKRVAFALSQPKGKVWGMIRALIDRHDYRNDFIRQQEAQRAEIAKGQKARIVDASREVTKAWKYDRDQLKATHKAEDDRKYQDTKQKSNTVWRQDGQNIAKSSFEQTSNVKENADKDAEKARIQRAVLNRRRRKRSRDRSR